MKEDVRSGWRREAAGWIRYAPVMAAWTRAAADLLVEGARARPGQAALDVACGAGVSTLAVADAVGPQGSVVGVDLVPEMVRGAEGFLRDRGVANVSLREADAEDLPFEDRSFDVVTCLHGAMFFPTPLVALREFHRVLRPGGRVSLVAWGPREANPFMGVVTGPYVRRMPSLPPEPEDAPSPFRFSAPGRLAALLREAGFEDVEERAVEIPWDFPGTAEAFLAAVREISSSLFDWFRSELPPEEFEAATAELRDAARARDDGTKVRFAATMVLATAARPA